MRKKVEHRPIFSIENPNKGWVVKELDKLKREWSAWLDAAVSWGDSSEYNPGTCAEVIKDGRENIRKHAILRERTMVFIGNNFAGYDFLFEDWPTHPHEDNLSRLRVVIPGWIHRLDALSSCAEYARVPDGYWRSKGKQLVDKVIEVGPDKGAEIAASWLKNPTAE
jgi:hypothetical protein